MELTFGTAQIHTSERLKSRPGIAKLFHKIFGYTNVGNYARFTVFKKLLRHTHSIENGKILDLGTGYGEYAISLASAYPNACVHALDIDTERIAAVKRATQKLELDNMHTHCKPIDGLRDKAFDLIFSIDVFEHIAPEKMPFQVAYDKLKPGGHFIVKIPNAIQRTLFPEKWFDEHHDWLEEEHIGQIYDLEGLKSRFRREGFIITHASYSDGWLSRFAWELAYLGKKTGLLGQLVTLPIAKLFIHADRLVHSNNWGNAIQVIGQKPLS
ncbi:hypothetical protein BFP97_05025 [Roseivirga sp. 4D4]|uniref:class I SAM-dependent methyltransferase n=1 Tax=Roseivirga sp. 4D4 TaxID=1889784 RepID=UPI000852BF08|nr:class I SAM-dependent methyltransferase [Roseivirga sp. 4D4]OEK00911.1 hypothetical protein BFP97_05025 [Roseivirga sp. 4D4]